MSDEVTEILAEDIDFEQWQRLLRFQYSDNIRTFLSSRNSAAIDDATVNSIAGSVVQAHDYFTAARTVTLNTSPLLYYYGVTNLLYAVCTLLRGTTLHIKEHGMRVPVQRELDKSDSRLSYSRRSLLRHLSISRHLGLRPRPRSFLKRQGSIARWGWGRDGKALTSSFLPRPNPPSRSYANRSRRKVQFRLKQNKMTRVADLSLIPHWNQSGALRQFCSVLADGVTLQKDHYWTLLEIIGSIPELKSDFERCYPDEEPYVVPLQLAKHEGRRLERIALQDVHRFKDLGSMLSRVENAGQAYLPCEKTNNFLILRHKLGGKEIGIYSVAGQKFLQLSHAKGSERITLPTLLYFFMGLFILGFVSRYRPEVWTPFARADQSGEREIVERFLRTARRVVPNLALDALFQTRHQFLTQARTTVDLSKPLTRDEVRDMIRGELRDS